LSALPIEALAEGKESLARRLVGPGASIGIGALSVEVRFETPHGAWEFAELYEYYPVQSEPGLADSHIVLKPQRTVSDWLRPRIQVYLEDQAPFAPVPRHHAVPLLESAINWSVFTQNLQDLVIHAGSLARGGKALILPGPPGSGKSTLCAELVARGWRLLSDEFAIVRPLDARLQALPRPISLKNDAIDLIARRHQSATFSRRYEGTAKGTVAYMRAPEEAVRRADQPVTPCLVIFPRYREGAPPTLERIDRARTFMDLICQSPNYFTLMATGFETMARVVESCDHYVLTYGSLDDATALVNQLADKRGS
jgi:HprK-related kinase A